jgi:Protein of unknown function (DUF3164)
MNSADIIEEQPENGTIMVNGRKFHIDAKGGHMPEARVKAQDKLQDETVRKIMGHAFDLSAQTSRFKAHTMADLSSLVAVLEQQYGFVAKGNKGKGNVTYMTYDALMMIKVQVADNITFGPELQIAKHLVDECLTEWSQDARDEIQAIILGAFDTDKEGRISRTRICSLLKLDIDDDRWQRAMAAIRDAQRVVGTKEYVRFYHRKRLEDAFTAVTIDMANA